MQRQTIFSTVIVLALALSGCATTAAGVDAVSIRNTMSGDWVLEEWHANNKIMRPPEVDGRWIMSKGRVTFITRNGGREGPFVITVGLGRYTIDPGEFAYGYDSLDTFSVDGDRTSAKHRVGDPPTKLTAAGEGNNLILRSAAGLEFKYSGETFTISMNGQVVRVWRRVGAN